MLSLMTWRMALLWPPRLTRKWSLNAQAWGQRTESDNNRLDLQKQRYVRKVWFISVLIMRVVLTWHNATASSDNVFDSIYLSRNRFTTSYLGCYNMPFCSDIGCLLPLTSIISKINTSSMFGLIKFFNFNSKWKLTFQIAYHFINMHTVLSKSWGFNKKSRTLLLWDAW